MQISTIKKYKHQEISCIFNMCPICNLNDMLEIKSSVINGTNKKGLEGIYCTRCNLQLYFSFVMNDRDEIIDSYLLDYCKLGNLEFKNDNAQLVLYANNTYVRNIDTNIVDLEKCKVIMMLA